MERKLLEPGQGASCPMMTEAASHLTDKQVEAFCRDGCSVDCEKLFVEYLKRIKKAPTTEATAVSARRKKNLPPL